MSVNYPVVLKYAATAIEDLTEQIHGGGPDHEERELARCQQAQCKSALGVAAKLREIARGDSDPTFSADVSTEIIRDKLLVCDVEVPIAEIEKWTVTQKAAAVNWAEASYLLASDNVLNEYCRAHDEDAEYDPPFPCICRPPKPEFLNGYPKAKSNFNGVMMKASQ